MDPIISLTAAINNATKVANTPFFATIIDRITGFKISQWAAESEVRKKLIHDEYEKAKQNGIMGVQYIENIRHTTNLIDTAVKSTKYINPDQTNNIKMDNDFFWNTIEHSKSVSNDEMQELIAKIIAGEYNKPGSYLMSTLQTLKMLGANEIKLFENVCSFLINNYEIPQNLFQGFEVFFIEEIGIMDFGSFQILQSLGLFLPNTITKFARVHKDAKIVINYFDSHLIFLSTIKGINQYLDTSLPPTFKLSPAGFEILKHLTPKKSSIYIQRLEKNYKIPGFKLTKD